MTPSAAPALPGHPHPLSPSAGPPPPVPRGRRLPPATPPPAAVPTPPPPPTRYPRGRGRCRPPHRQRSPPPGAVPHLLPSLVSPHQLLPGPSPALAAPEGPALGPSAAHPPVPGTGARPGVGWVTVWGTRVGGAPRAQEGRAGCRSTASSWLCPRSEG